MFWSWSRFLAVSLQVTDTHLMALFPGLPGWAGTRKVKPIWILLKQETVSGNGISRAICKSAPCTRQITTPAPHHSSFLQAGCPSCHPTNSIKVLKVTRVKNLAVGCHYFLPSLQLPSQPLRGLLPILLLGEQRHDGCESLPKTVTLQHRSCDLNAGPSAPESSMLTTLLPSHPFFALCYLNYVTACEHADGGILQRA